MRHWNSPSLKLPTNNEGKRGKNKTGAIISLYTVDTFEKNLNMTTSLVREELSSFRQILCCLHDIYCIDLNLCWFLFCLLFFVFCPFHCIVELIFSATLAFSVFIFVSCFQGNYTCIEWCFSQFYAFLCCLCTLLSLF